MALFGLFGWKNKVKKLRKKWDRLREKSLNKNEPLRGSLLQKLDGLENNLRTLEEQNMDKVSRARLSKELEIGLEEIKAILKLKPEEMEIQTQPAGA